jgi:predicted dinucleotide-binding enzyme
MRFGVLGTGMVGHAIASKLISLGHEVLMGARQAGNARALAWAAAAGPRARAGSFTDAARFGEVVINATAGAFSIEALRAAGAEHLAGKLLIDVANPIDPASGMPPQLAVCNTDSLAEQIQRAFPQARVVKTLNTVNADVMVNPALLPGSHTIFVCGNDAAAKAQTVTLLHSFGWPAEAIYDLGDISAARGAEMYLALWLRLWGAIGSPHFNIHVVAASQPAVPAS